MLEMEVGMKSLEDLHFLMVIRVMEEKEKKLARMTQKVVESKILLEVGEVLMKLEMKALLVLEGEVL